jgi:transposase
MNKKYIVDLSSDERDLLHEVIKRLSGSSQKVRRAHILLKADAGGSRWTDQHIAEAFNCRIKTVENLRRRFVEQGFEVALEGQKRVNPPVAKLLDGEQEAKVIAMRLGSPPAGYAHWTLRLLARKLIELEVVETISHETVRQTLKKTA